jgi:hypothetical protein
VAEHVAQEMDGAALPPAAQHLGDGRDQAGVGVGHDQLDPVQPTGAQRPQEATPEGFGLGLAHVDADHLPASGRMDPVGDHQGLMADPARSRTRSTLASNHRYG